MTEAESETAAVSSAAVADDDQTVAYQIEPADKSRSPSPMDDIDATIPYDMTQGDNLAKSSVSDSPDTDIEGTIPYEMTQGVLDDGGDKSPGGSRVDIEPTIPYEMSDASSPLVQGDVDDPMVDESDKTVGVADPAAMDDATVAVHDNGETMAVDDATMGVTDPTVGMPDSTEGVADPTVALNDATVAVNNDDTTMAVDDATVGMADPTLALNDQTADTDATQAIDDDPTVGIDLAPLVGVAHPKVMMNDHDDTQSIGDHQDDDDDDATLDVAVPAVDTDPDHLQQTKHDETEDVITSNATNSNHSPTHQPAASSPIHSPMKTSPAHSPTTVTKTTPIIKDSSPKSPSSSTPKKVHFASTGRPSSLDVPVSDLLNDEESPDVEVSIVVPVLLLINAKNGYCLQLG